MDFQEMFLSINVTCSLPMWTCIVFCSFGSNIHSRVNSSVIV